jgi:hypothetical protein
VYGSTSRGDPQAQASGTPPPRWDDDPLPPPPVVEIDGHLFLELSLVLDVVERIWRRPALAFRRSVEVGHHRWVEAHPDLYPDGCPGIRLVHRELGAGSTQRRAAA